MKNSTILLLAGAALLYFVFFKKQGVSSPASVAPGSSFYTPQTGALATSAGKTAAAQQQSNANSILGIISGLLNKLGGSKGSGGSGLGKGGGGGFGGSGRSSSGSGVSQATRDEVQRSIDAYNDPSEYDEFGNRFDAYAPVNSGSSFDTLDNGQSFSGYDLNGNAVSGDQGGFEQSFGGLPGESDLSEGLGSLGGLENSDSEGFGGVNDLVTDEAYSYED